MARHTAGRSRFWPQPADTPPCMKQDLHRWSRVPHSPGDTGRLPTPPAKPSADEQRAASTLEAGQDRRTFVMEGVAACAVGRSRQGRGLLPAPRTDPYVRHYRIRLLP